MGSNHNFFILSQDLAEKKCEALGSVFAAGHEIANYSLHHEPRLYLYSEKPIENELVDAEEHNQGTTGQNTVGFRAPGFRLSYATSRVLTLSL